MQRLVQRAPSDRFISPTAFEQARGGALGAGGGRVGFAMWGSPGVVSSESAAGFCGLRGLGRLLGSGLVAPVWVSGVWRAVVECLVHVCVCGSGWLCEGWLLGSSV